MKQRVLGLLFFLLITAVVVGFIKMANWLPLVFQQETLRQYSSVEEVRSALQVKDLYVPAYFPQTISWPPSLILAQTRPSAAFMMTFNRRNSAETALIITQAVSNAFDRTPGLKLIKVAESTPYQLHDRTAILEVGTCRNGEQCSRISWQEGRYQMALLMKAPPFELIRIAESMVH